MNKMHDACYVCYIFYLSISKGEMQRDSVKWETASTSLNLWKQKSVKLCVSPERLNAWDCYTPLHSLS